MKKRVLFQFLLLVSLLFSACDENNGITLSGLKVRDFQTDVNDQLTDLYVLKNKAGMEVCVTNYGARVVSIMVPDRYGKMEDVVCGFDNIAKYMENKQNFGAVMGRYIGRILNANFTLDSVNYRLMANTGVHCSHGGDPGFASRIWQAEKLDDNTLRLSYFSPDGENGFPGNLSTQVIYSVTDKNELDIRYEAETDKPTVINLSNHCFFNLSGDFSTTILDEMLTVNADSYTPYDSTKCVTGEILPVTGTPLDFTSAHRIGERIDTDWMQLNVTKGYDHNWVLNTKGDDTKPAARLVDGQSGRTLDIYTNEPGLQIYTANGLKGNLVGKRKKVYESRCAICLEAQHFADSPNKPQFPSTVLRPGEKYDSHCIFRFGVL
ncbi:aldose epimerase family protein [uncultured Bacteroides sp.]|uniref:aldose epimerase family protein n=1 Tax=uncultured Bacteroides sp. TaxID=162156 RepID=UPI002AA8B4A2|nr:aldose epimerase family protein [uncultured Bacteroides sp.]